MTNTEKILESPRSFGDSRMSGKSTSQGMFLLECIYKGEKYTVFDSIRNKVHIIPDKHLKEIIAQAIAEERDRVVEAMENMKKGIREEGDDQIQFNCGYNLALVNIMSVLSSLDKQDINK